MAAAQAIQTTRTERNQPMVPDRKFLRQDFKRSEGQVECWLQGNLKNLDSWRSFAAADGQDDITRAAQALKTTIENCIDQLIVQSLSNRLVSKVELIS